MIFFLAHDGVRQPAVWDAWLAQCGAVSARLGSRRRVLARVFCNAAHAADAFMRGRRLRFDLETAWGTPSLVQALQTGYAHILAEFNEQLDMVFLVSGHDIPIMAPSAFFALPVASYIPRVDALEALDGADFDALDIARIWPPSQPQPQRFSVQWIHLTAEHARIVAAAPLHAYVEWLDALNAACAQTYLYDEVLPCVMLEAAGITSSVHSVSGVRDEPLTAMDRQCAGDPSPITWTSLTVKRAVARPEDKGVRLSLRDVLQEYRADEFVFFRKVAATVAFPARGAWP